MQKTTEKSFSYQKLLSVNKAFVQLEDAEIQEKEETTDETK